MSTFSFIGKSVSATYFNMARDNYHRTIMDILSKVQINKDSVKEVDCNGKTFSIPTDESNIDRYLAKIQEVLDNTTNGVRPVLSNDDQLKFRHLLFYHFPILGPIMANIISRNFSKKGKEHKTRLSNVVESGSCDASLSECLKVLVELGRCLTDSRNYFTHYNPYNEQESLKEMYERQKRVSYYLDEVFTASRRIDKDRRNLTSEEMQFITSEAYKALTDEKGKFKRNDKGRKIIGKNHDYYFSIVGESFIHKEGEQYIQKVFDDKQVFVRDTRSNALSDFGQLYLCCCFITRHYASLYADRSQLLFNSPYAKEVAGIIDPYTPQNNILQEMLSIYRIRLPRGKRLDMKDTKTSVALDMLNELNRCPMPLFEHLSPEGQKAFEDKVKRTNEKTPEVSLRIRSTDRFPYLALRAIDETDILPRIRFQVQLGSYRFHFYEKDCIDGGTKLRCMSKDINGFGRLQDIEKLRKTTWTNTVDGEQEENKLQQKEYVSTLLEDGETCLDLLQPVEDRPGNNPYITDHQASYNIHSNRIGLYWESHNKANNQYLRGEGLTYLPELRYTTEEHAGKMVQKAAIDQPSPKCSLSTYELRGLLFYHYLYKKYGTKDKKRRTAEKIIIDKYDNLLKLLEDVENNGRSHFFEGKKGITEEDLQKKLKEFDLSIDEIPEKLRKYLRNRFVTQKLSFGASKAASERLIKVCGQLERFQKDTKKIKGGDNKYAKKGYARISHGRLGQILAQSIVDWLPEGATARRMLTGLNFNKMQASLATFNDTEGHQFADLLSMMNRAHLLNRRLEGEGTAQFTVEGHPFLKQVMDTLPKDIEMLYVRYLKMEKKHLIKILVQKIYDEKNDSYRYLSIKDDFTPKGGEQFACKEDIDLRAIPFVHPDNNKWKKRDDDFCKSLAKRYQEHIELPDGLFIKDAIELLRSVPECAIMFDNNFREEDCNMSHLVNLYLTRVLHDNSQSYYGSSDERFYRAYDLFNILEGRTVRNEQMPVYHSCEEILNRLGSREAKDYVKKSIEAYVNRINKQGTFRNLEEAREQKRNRLTDAINEVKKNEKAIRRYKTQDIVLFLTAKQMLIQTEAVSDGTIHSDGKKGNVISLGSYKPKNNKQEESRTGISEMRLAEVFEGPALGLPVDYDYNYSITWYVDNEGKEVSKKDRVRTITRTVNITQSNMSIKNYGRLLQVLKDDRLEGLLKMLIQYVERKEQIEDNGAKEYYVGYRDLIGEFFNFDHLRPDVFSEVHRLESSAFPMLEDKTSPTTYSFNGLMKLLFQEVAAKPIIAIRNAFVHGNYRVKEDLLNIPEGENATKFAVPNVAQIMKNQIVDKDCENDRI